MPWGVAEAKALGLYDILISAGGNLLTHWDTYQGAERTGHRDLRATSTPKEPILACSHPGMQEACLSAAEDAGAAVYRGVRVRGLSASPAPGPGPELEFETGGQSRRMTARLVVGADGRDSSVRAWAAFPSRQDPDRNLVAGVLLEGLDIADDAAHVWLEPQLGHFVLHFPQGKGVTRAYLCYAAGSLPRLGGRADLPRFLENCVASGVPAGIYSEAKQVGPLATFSGATTWGQGPCPLPARRPDLGGCLERLRRLRRRGQRLHGATATVLPGGAHDGGLVLNLADEHRPRGRRFEGQGVSSLGQGPRPEPRHFHERPR